MAKKRIAAHAGPGVPFPDIGAFVATSTDTSLLADAAAALHKLDEDDVGARRRVINEDWEALAKQIVGAETL